MGLFDKKYCDICGEKIGVFGNRKLADGNCCKDCAAKLSPFFTERKQASIADIKEQLEYREANKARVAAFTPTLTVGEDKKIYIDENQGQFLISGAKHWADENPDVFEFSDVIGCQLDVDEHQTEIKTKDAEGHTQSLNPRCYAYSYDFYVIIDVNNPWFDQIKFKLNNRTVGQNVQTVIPMGTQPFGGGAARPAQPVSNKGVPGQQKTFQKGGVTVSIGRPQVQRTGMRPTNLSSGNRSYTNQGGFGNQGMYAGNMGVMTSNAAEVQNSFDYKNYEQMGMEIREILMSGRQYAREEAMAAAAPQQAVTCPYCGATTFPDANGCCEYCGGALIS